MKNPSKKSSKHQQPLQEDETQRQPEHHNLLQYYKSKIDSLCEQRLRWLAKFDQCRSKLQQKHSLKQKLLLTKNDQRQLNRNIIHHQIALMDEKLNVIRMDRENLMNDYRDAQEVIKISDLMDQYPNQIEKMLPCYSVNGTGSGDLIKNELNIHNSRQKRSAASRFTKKSPPNNFNIKNSLSKKSQKRNSFAEYSNLLNADGKSSEALGKITPEQLLQRQIIQLSQNHQQELQTMEQFKSKLQQLIKRTKEQQKQKLNKERQIVNQLARQYKDLQKRHKSLAEEYFTGRREQKKAAQDLNKEKQQLLNKNKILEEKVNKQIKTYEKQNKAKQTLIIKKSEDFQQNYRAKMRAKQRNLQALKQNYQKMQNICIQKVTKLQNALNKSKHQLKQAQQRRQFLVDELREQLHTLQKRVQQQKLQREQRELKLRLKAEKQKLRYEEEKQRKQKEKAKAEKNRLIEQSYKRTVKAQKNKSVSKDHSKSKKSLKALPKKKEVTRKDIYGKPGQQSQEDESLQMDDLQNIRRQIGELQTKIAADTR